MYEDLLADEPEIETETAFKHLEDFREFHVDLTVKLEELKKDPETNKKAIKKTKKTIDHLGTFIKYVDIDFDDTKKKLYPLLKAGKITYDLLWTIFKPGEIIYTPDYEGDGEPHCMKYRSSSYNKCKGYFGITGSIIKFDDDKIGMATNVNTLYGFRGSKPITSLHCYPFRYHPQQREIRQNLIERGKKYIECQGIHHRRYDGFAYLYVEERQRMMKMNVNGRIMVDFVNFKKNMPNYYDLNLDARDGDLETTRKKDEEDITNHTFAVIKTKAGIYHVAKIETDEEGNETTPECEIEEDKIDPIYKNVRICEDELLLCCPVVYGFSFSQKSWIEFAVSKLEEVIFTPEAFHSLVIPDSQKSIIKALVRSHTLDTSRNIDDVIAGKGQGLVSVLHGPPGVGKTLTAEGIAELVRRPLYSVSVGELGTSTSRLEENLKTILDVAHAWGAVLLLDEADVFLEARDIHDINRNALVSIFLRLLEYFQGIMFLTTNRVETFDPAFQSRIHVAIRYDDLSQKARLKVWNTFVQRVRDLEGVEVEEFTDDDFTLLSKKIMNGRQIKNVVRTAQALALDEGVPLGMRHVINVIDVQKKFDEHLKGGTGYVDAMNNYS